MSNPVSPLNGASFDGFAKVREIGPLGMITLRAKAGTKGLDKAIKAATGCAVPGQRQIVTAGENAAGWMSPDEFLLVLPYAEVATAMDAISEALKGEHHLAATVVLGLGQRLGTQPIVPVDNVERLPVSRFGRPEEVDQAVAHVVRLGDEIRMQLDRAAMVFDPVDHGGSRLPLSQPREHMDFVPAPLQRRGEFGDVNGSSPHWNGMEALPGKHRDLHFAVWPDAQRVH